MGAHIPSQELAQLKLQLSELTLERDRLAQELAEAKVSTSESSARGPASDESPLTSLTQDRPPAFTANPGELEEMAKQMARLQASLDQVGALPHRDPC